MAVYTSQSSQGVIWLYCIINKQSVTNLRSTNSVRYELACVSVEQYNIASYNLLNSVNILVL